MTCHECTPQPAQIPMQTVVCKVDALPQVASCQLARGGRAVHSSNALAGLLLPLQQGIKLQAVTMPHACNWHCTLGSQRFSNLHGRHAQATSHVAHGVITPGVPLPPPACTPPDAELPRLPAHQKTRQHAPLLEAGRPGHCERQPAYRTRGQPCLQSMALCSSCKVLERCSYLSHLLHCILCVLRAAASCSTP